jgi:ubiquinone/menaquinone biosynthesis C-methylase UbiE
MESQEQTWDNIAEKWNRFRTKVSPTVESFLKEQKGNVLDVGCGSGRNFIKIKGIKWFGVDFSQEMLKLAEDRSKQLKIKTVLTKASSQKLPFEDNSFDAVLCYALLHCINSCEGREKTLKEISRVLKPGGKALISSWGDKSPRLKNKGKECFVPWTIRGEDKVKRYTYVFNLKELEDLVKKVGFRVLRAWEERNVNLIVEK